MRIPPPGYSVRSISVADSTDTLAAHVMHGLPAENGAKRWQRGSIFLVIRGTGSFEDEHGVHHELAPGTIGMHPPGRWHSIRRTGHERWIEASVSFGSVISKYLVDLGVIDVNRPVQRTANSDAWLVTYAHYRRALNDPAISDIACLTAAMAVLSCPSILTMTNDDEIIYRSRIDLANDVQGLIDLNAYAEQLGLSYAHFRRRFTAAVGCAPATWRRRHRLEHAALLLRVHRLSVADAAIAVGYATPFAFSRRFRGIFSMSPSAYAQCNDGGHPADT